VQIGALDHLGIQLDIDQAEIARIGEVSNEAR